MDHEINVKEEKNKNKNNEKLIKQAQPNFMTNLIVNRPCIVLLICSLFFIGSTFLTIYLKWYQKNKDVHRDWFIWEEQKVKNYDVYNEIQQLFKKSQVTQQVPKQTEDVDYWQTYVMLECQDQCDNVLNEKGINMLYTIENQIRLLDDYNKFCFRTVLEEDKECSEYSLISITDTFTEQHLKDNHISKNEIQNTLNQITQEEEFPNYRFMLGKDFSLKEKKTKYLLSVFKFGGPLFLDNKSYLSQYDRTVEQDEYFLEFSKKVQDIIDENNKNNDDMQILIYSEALFHLQLNQALERDTLLIIGCISFVWFYLTIHIKSIFLSTFAMISIIMSFPLTLMIFRLVLQVTYFGSIHVMIIFVILGIAADDVFVFMDAWTQTNDQEYLKNDLNKRMAVTFKRAAKSMLATSSTTSAAFVATGLSQIMPISSLGIFASILIPMNFLLIITFFPALLIIHHKYIQKFTSNIASKYFVKNKISNKVQQIEMKETTPENNLNIQNTEQVKQQQQNTNNFATADNFNVEIVVSGQQSSNQNNPTTAKVSPYQTLDNFNPVAIKEIKKEKKPNTSSIIENFFYNQFNSFVYMFRFPILILTLIWVGISVIQSLKMGPIEKPEKWLPQSYGLQRAIEHLQDDMQTSGKDGIRIKVNVFWGVKSLDHSSTSNWDSENVGEVVWDDSFDISSEQNQQYFYDTCLRLKNEDIVQDQDISCFMLDFRDFVLQHNHTFPIQQEYFPFVMSQFIQNPIGYQYYLQNYLGVFQDQLRYVAIELSSTGHPDDVYQDMQKIEQKWQNLIDDINENAPLGLDNAIQTSYNWVWMISQKAFVDNAIQGLIIALLFSFVVLLLVSMNIIVSLYSVISIMGILASVIHIMYLQGWTIGITESINIIILNGFSVDYVVHLSNHFVESSHIKKYDKMRSSLKEIGVSIMSGSITTFISGMFLMFSILNMFVKFSIIIVTTIAFSLYFSLFFFSALIHVIGPEGKQGSINCRKINTQKLNQVNNSNTDKGNTNGKELKEEQTQ